MMITRDNYEPFFLDYLEGNLAENILDQFLDFLGQNPDLKEELHLFENIHLPEEQAVYQDKAHLYKSVQDEKSAFEIKSIAFMEGDLNDEERKLFEAYLTNHTELQKEYNLFAKTRLVADPSINYQDKQKLYRRSGTATVMNWVARVAAVVAIVWGISSLFQTGNRPDRPTTVHEITAAKPQPAAPVIKVEPKRPNPEIAEKPIDRANPKQSSIR